VLSTTAPDEKVIFVPFLHALGGVEQLVLSLGRYLHERGIPHRIVCFSQTVDLARCTDFPLNITALQPPRNTLSEARALRAFARSRAASSSSTLIFELKGAFYASLAATDNYCLHLTDPPSLLPADVSKYALSVGGRLPVIGIKGASMVARGELAHCINRRGVRRASTVIAMTHAIESEIKALYGVTPRVVRPGVKAVGSNNQRHAPTDHGVRLLSVCRLEPSKRLDALLHALARLSRTECSFARHSSWTLNIVGDGSERANLMALAQELDLQSHVVFHGILTDFALELLYEETSFVLIPAAQGYGLPALEALERNIPVILSNSSGVAEILEATPWVAITEDLDADLDRAIMLMTERVLCVELSDIPLPPLPTERTWAENISSVCGWTC
jgi:glycosyltransferase involved in cell wall biosynthesis